ncbi:hypothetical protein DL93DRAFT_2159228 [Clavulina sp. PMI_390]|nr:hypothetical protein DL93DRAFT_2159228 [Clavulina sp. PMI_390]
MSAAVVDSKKLSPLYDALDQGQFKTAIQLSTKLLKKHPKSLILKTLKSLALIRSQKHDEGVVLCDEVFAARPTDENVLQALTMVLRVLERYPDIITLYEDAFKKEPKSEELGSQAFLAMVRVGSWKSAQQLAHKLSKTFNANENASTRYLGWTIMCALLQATDPMLNDQKTKTVVLSIAQRFFAQLPVTSNHTTHPEKLILLLDILLAFPEPKYKEAFDLLETESGKKMIAASLEVEERRRLIWSKLGRYAEERELCVTRLTAGDRNWLTFTSYLDSTFALITASAESSAPDDTTAVAPSPTTLLKEARAQLTSVAELDGRKGRSAQIALLEFAKRLRSLPTPTEELEGQNTFVEVVKAYIEMYTDKPSCFEDVRSYVDEMKDDEKAKLMEYVKSIGSNISTASSLSRTINAFKLLRYAEPSPSTSSELAHAEKYFRLYLEATRILESIGAKDPEEVDPADDLALLAANALISEWAKDKSVQAPLNQAIFVLEFAATRSPYNFRYHLVLIRLYLFLGAHAVALEHYKLLRIRSVQHETLSHYLMDRSTTWSAANDGDLTLHDAAVEVSAIYQENANETPEMLAKALLFEKYSQVQGFIDFEDKLDRSLHRDVIRMDQIRMRCVVEPPTTETLQLEIGELDYMFLPERMAVHHDNRDYSVLPDFQPASSKTSIDELTKLGPRIEGKWCDIFVQLYIRIMNRAAEATWFSPHVFKGFKPEDLNQFTEAERIFVKYGEILYEWMWPADKPRPEVDPETAKGDPKYIPNADTAQSPAPNGTPAANGNGSAVKEANGTANGKEEHTALIELAETDKTAEGALACVEAIAAMIKTLIESSGPTWEILHATSILQETFVVLGIQSMPLGPQTVKGKQQKADPLWAAIKNLKNKISTIMHDVSTQLVAYGDSCDTPERQATFLKDCDELIAQDPELAKFVETLKHNTVRKAAISAIGRGIGKIADGKRPVLQAVAA